MILSEEDRNTLVSIRLKKAKETMSEVYGLFYLRQDGDYDDWFDINEQDVMPLIDPAEKLITEIEKLINS